MDGQATQPSNMKTHIIWLVIVIVVGVASFFGGMKYQQSKTPAATARTGQFGGAGGGAAGGFTRRTGAGGSSAGSFVNGQVLSVASNNITVKNMAGGSQIVILAPSTAYRMAVDGTASDVTVGSMVTVTGTTNSDGSLTAQSVQIRTGTSTPASGTTPPAAAQ